MPTLSLFEEGWRQGSLIKTALTVSSYDFDDDLLRRVDHEFPLWALATQDCDLHSTKCTNNTRQFELRPLFPAAGERVDGIRNRSAFITDDLVLKADSQKLTLTARALNSLKQFRDNSVGGVRRREIKSWLGLRYDRPAVPIPFEHIVFEILHPAIIEAMPASLQGKIRDVLVDFQAPNEIRLFVILRDGDDRDICLAWLDDIVQSLITDHNIIVVDRQVEDASQTPYSVIETYYGLDSAELSRSADSQE